MRYVQEAPLRSLRANLGLLATGTSTPFASGGTAISATMQTKVKILGATVAKLEC